VARILKACCLAIFFIWLGAVNAIAATIQFAANVTQVPVDDVFGDITFGQQIQGSFSFDPAAVDLAPADPATGIYQSGAPFGMTVTIGTHQFTTSGSLTVGILNSFVDQYTVFATSASGDLTLELFLQDNRGIALSSDQLPPSLPSLSDFAQRDFHLDAVFDEGEVQVDGQLAGATAQATPEPSAAGLGFVGSLVLLALARMRKRGTTRHASAV
jgi:hypothetical protein